MLLGVSTKISHILAVNKAFLRNLISCRKDKRMMVYFSLMNGIVTSINAVVDAKVLNIE